jgi:hypothetical protein
MRVKKRAGREKEDVLLMTDRLLKKNGGNSLAGRARGKCRPDMGIAPHPR